MLRCEECTCVSQTGDGWLGYLVADPEGHEPPEVAVYCPPCAQRELDARSRQPSYI